MSRITVALFGNRAKAEPLKKRLQEAGFEPEVHDNIPRLEKLWFVSRSEACARLDVSADQFEQAERKLLDWDAAGDALQHAIHCPECKSLRVDYPQFTRNSMLTNLAMGLLAELRLVEKEFYCSACHYTWPREGTRPRRDRSHTAPYYFIEGVEQTSKRQPPPSAERIREAA